MLSCPVWKVLGISNLSHVESVTFVSGRYVEITLIVSHETCKEVSRLMIRVISIYLTHPSHQDEPFQYQASTVGIQHISSSN